jgi:hypothetical protein
MMYRPPGYAEYSNPNLPYCCSCKLQPCIAEVYHDKAQEFVNDQFYEKKRTVSVVQK